MPQAQHTVTINRPVDAVFANRLIEFRTVTGPARPHGRYDFESVEGKTRLSFALDAKLTGISKLLMGSMVQKTMESEVATLDRLKQVLET